MEHDLAKAPIPNLFLVGAPKCGTTSLYEYLRSHPQIFFPTNEDDFSRTKEPNHFCPELDITEEHSIKDRRDYLDLYSGSETAAWRGDASVYNLLSESAPARIKQFSPDARILVMLRPPLDMMRSYHSELFRHHHEDIVDFHDAVNASEDRRNGLRIPEHTGVPKCLDYLAISRFSPQVARYQQVFGPQKVKVVLLEDLVAAPEETFRGILAFLGVDESFRPAFVVHNETPRHGRVERYVTFLYKQLRMKRVVHLFMPRGARRKFLSAIRGAERNHATPDLRDVQLLEACRQDVEQLSKLIGRDLHHWQPGSRH